MSVYIPKNKAGQPKSPYYHFDFVLKPVGKIRSERFCGSTGQKTKKAAEAVEARFRELAALGKLSNLMTVAEATARYLQEKVPEVPDKIPGEIEPMEVRARRKARMQQEHCMRQLEHFYGGETPLIAIDSDVILRAVTKRKTTELTEVRIVDGELEEVGNGKFPAPATVNRQVVEPMRRLLRRAKKKWKVPVDLEQFQWGGEDGLKEEEPEDRNRELSVTEEIAFWDALHPDYHLICELYIITGKRQSLWLLLPKTRERVDLHAGRVKMRKLKKRREEWHSPYLFTAESQRPHENCTRRPITTQMLYDAVAKALATAGIKDFRPHDFRHTFGSRAARKSGGNIKVLQNSMDHSSIRSTLRYINVLQDEVTGLRANVTVTKQLPPNVEALRKKGSK